MQFNKANKTVVKTNSSFFSCFSLVIERRFTDVQMENDPLEYVELVGDLRTSLKLTAVFQTAMSE